MNYIKIWVEKMKVDRIVLRKFLFDLLLLQLLSSANDSL